MVKGSTCPNCGGQMEEKTVLWRPIATAEAESIYWLKCRDCGETFQSKTN